MSEDTPPYGTSDPPRIPTEFEEMRTPADLAFASLEYAAEELGSSPSYRLFVSRQVKDNITADQLVDEFDRLRSANPRAPRIIVLVDETLIGHSWYLEANGRKFGSRMP